MEMKKPMQPERFIAGMNDQNTMGRGWQRPKPPEPTIAPQGLAGLPNPAQNIMGGQNMMGGAQPQQLMPPAMAPAAPQPNPQMAAMAQALMQPQAPQPPQMPQMVQPPQMMNRNIGAGMNNSMGGMGALRRPLPTRAY